MKTRLLETRAARDGRNTLDVAFEIKAVSETGLIEGYGSVFGVRDLYDDVIIAGAFKATLAEHKANGTLPAMLWQHDSGRPIGAWLDMYEDTRGLYVKGQLALDTVGGSEAFALLKLKAIKGLSIGFISVPGTSKYNDEGVRILSALDLWEVSLVTFPGNTEALVTSVKSADEFDALRTPKDAEAILRDAGFSKSGATALVSRVMRMGESRRDSADDAGRAIKAAQSLLENLQS